MVGGTLRITSIWKRKEEGKEPTLEVRETNGFLPGQKDLLIKLLVKSGLTVRFYDPEEKNWMDISELYGVVRAPGSRDGTWGKPDLDEFEKDYLPIV